MSIVPKTRNLFLFILTFMYFLSIASPAYAYLDPGTGSMILQGIIAGLAITSVTIKMWWYKIKSLFKISEKKEMNEMQDDGTSEPTTPE